MAAYKDSFDWWVEEHGRPGEIYVHVMDFKHVYGHVFDRIEYNIDTRYIDNWRDVAAACHQRIRRMGDKTKSE